jgi:hypothetical protein
MNRRPYAGEITKEYLQKLGIEYVSTDGTIVIKKGEQAGINFNNKAKKSYGLVALYDPELRAATPKEERKNTTGNIMLGVHVLNYVWNKEDKPAGLVIDHKDNDPRNNDLSNLQMITQGENIAKERDNWNVYELKCKLNKPRSFYQDKLEKYLVANEEAKKAGDAEASHKLRTSISQTRARLRYYDNHILEALELQKAQEELEARKREYHERAQKKKELKANVESARKFYKELEKAYGKDDPIVQQYWGEWKLAIAMYYGFCAESKLEA